MAPSPFVVEWVERLAREWEVCRAPRRAVVPGGVVLYETFTTLQRALGTGPTSPDHLLEPGELRARFDGWSVLAYEETRYPEAVARIATRRPGIIKNSEFGIKNSR